jgi:TonB family protein
VTRAFPVSFLGHLLVLALILWFGSHISRQVIPRQRTISVRMARPPRPEPVIERSEPQAEPEPPPVAQERTEPEREPAVVPEAPEQVAEPEPEPVAKREEPVAAEPEQVVEADEAAEQPVVGTDVVVPPRFKYYIDLLESRIARNWHPKRLGFRETSTRVCRIHFHVEQDGLITRETIVQSSGVPLMDRESLKAVRAVGHFMPLPRGLADNALGVTYTFTLTAGN